MKGTSYAKQITFKGAKSAVTSKSENNIYCGLSSNIMNLSHFFYIILQTTMYFIGFSLMVL